MIWRRVVGGKSQECILGGRWLKSYYQRNRVHTWERTSCFWEMNEGCSGEKCGCAVEEDNDGANLLRVELEVPEKELEDWG